MGEVSFSFIDDKNKILPIDENQSYYFAGKLNEILFISKEYSINNNVITFTVDTYTEPFLAEITKRNTEIQIELGYNTDGVQTVLLRDFAYAQPRVYIEGLNPGKVNFSDYYTKEEVDQMFSTIDVSIFYTKEETNTAIQNAVNKIEIPDKLSELENDTGFITVNDIPEIPDKLSELENDTGFITVNDIPEQGGVKTVNGQSGDVVIDTLDITYQDVYGIAFESYTYNTVVQTVSYEIVSIPEGIRNAMCTFTTDENGFTYTLNIDGSYKINKPFEFEAGSTYVIAVDNNVILWSKIETVEG